MAERTLRPALARADEELGRRHPFSCMIAALLATAIHARDQIDEAAALLANRLDILERGGTPGHGAARLPHGGPHCSNHGC
ncbi:hypothetical protein ACU4GD_21640 [Cupriavidus basilensis]